MISYVAELYPLAGTTNTPTASERAWPSGTSADIATGSSTTHNMSMGREDLPERELDAEYASFKSALMDVFQSIRDGLLEQAYEPLLNISDWLLSHVVELGMFSQLYHSI